MLGRCGLGDCGLDEIERLMVQRFDPCDELDSNSFFIAVFRKRSSVDPTASDKA